MTTISLLNTPGLERHTPAVWSALAAIADRHGWNADGLAALIEHESGWNPAARNPLPGQTATGLIQFTANTAKALGTSVEELAKMSALGQLPFVEQYFLNWSKRHPLGPWDWMVFGLGAGNLPPGPLTDSGVLYPAGSQASKVNPGLVDADGAIRVGSIRRRLQQFAARFASRPRLPVPVKGGGGTSAGTFPAATEGAGVSSAAGLVGVAAALAGLASQLKALREDVLQELADVERQIAGHMATVREEIDRA